MKLKLHTKPDVPLEAESITPAVINKLKKKEIEKINTPEYKINMIASGVAIREN